jgi:CheY-like chemotaxis protein
MLSASDILNASILIVDDQDANVKLLERLLGEAGYANIASTMSPRDVDALHRKNRYDLILLDLQMPGMDGFEVMECLKTNDQDSYLPVIVLTAQPAHKLRALQAGAKDFITTVRLKLEQIQLVSGVEFTDVRAIGLQGA